MRYFFLTLIILNFSYSQCQGDTNLDDIINIQDLVLVINHILGIEYLEGEGLENADANNDEGINVVDIVTITNLIINNLNQCEDSIIDLSLDWEFEEDLSYFDYEELSNIINTSIADLNYLRGIVIIHNGKIISEEYYDDSSVSEIYNIWSVTKSYTSTLIGQAIDQGLIFDSDYTLNNFFCTTST